MKYLAIWPGQPGGYAPVIAAEMVADPRVQERDRLAAEGQSQRATRFRPPKPKPGRRSIIGISAKADQAVREYEERGRRMAASAG